MKKEDIEYLKTTTECKKKAEETIVTCFHPDCSDKSINSHLLQKNGILSKIAPNKHLWQLEIDNFSENQFNFRQRGLNEIFSFNCFCNEHDTKLFKKIESGDIDFKDYQSCLLFSLRTLYNEIFRKEVNIKHFECLMQKMPEKFDNERFRKNIEGDRLGIEDLRFTEQEIWNDIVNNTESFVFAYREMNRADLCISSIFTYDTSMEIQNLAEGQRPAEFMINFFPYKEKSILLMGYHKSDEKKVKGYFNCFFKESEKRIQRPLTNLMLFLCETWVCSDVFFKSRIQSNESYFYDAIRFSAKNYNERKIFDINIFDATFSSKIKAWAKEYT